MRTLNIVAMAIALFSFGLIGWALNEGTVQQIVILLGLSCVTLCGIFIRLGRLITLVEVNSKSGGAADLS